MDSTPVLILGLALLLVMAAAIPDRSEPLSDSVLGISLNCGSVSPFLVPLGLNATPEGAALAIADQEYASGVALPVSLTLAVSVDGQ